MIETPARYCATLGLEPQGAPEAYVFPHPSPVLSPPLSLCFPFFSFILYPLKTNKQTKGKNPAWGASVTGLGEPGGLGGGLYRGGLGPVVPAPGAGLALSPSCPRVTIPGGSACRGMPHGQRPPPFPPQITPPRRLSGFLRSKAVPSPGCVPTASPGPCAFVSPSPAGGRGGGPAPRDAPKPLACPLRLFPPLGGCLALSLPAPAGNWDKGQVGAARSACCWQRAAEPLPAPCLHVLEGGRQRAVLGRGHRPTPWLPVPGEPLKWPPPPPPAAGCPQRGFFSSSILVFVVFLPVSARLLVGADPLQGGGSPLGLRVRTAPPRARSPPPLTDDSGTTWCNFCDFCIF